MKPIRSPGIYFLVAVILFATCAQSCVAAASPSQGGPGTIDPAAVSVHDTVKFALGQDLNKDHYSGPYGTDSAGNYILGSSVGAYSGLAYISKFAHSGGLLWRRQRVVTTSTVSDPTAPGGSTTKYYEQYSTNQTPVEIGANDGNSYAILAAIVVDRAGNSFVGYDMANNYSGDYTQYTLIVKFDPNGVFQWRRSGPVTQAVDNGLYPLSLLKKLVLGDHGSVTAMIDNFYRGNPSFEQSVVVKWASDGTVVANNRYGRTSSGQTLYNSTPVDLTVDPSGNIYLLSFEVSAAGIKPPVPAVPSSVVRKLGPAGNALARTEIPFVRDARSQANDSLQFLKSDTHGNLYAVGGYNRPRASFSSSDQGESKELVIKFSSRLTQLWRGLGPQPTRSFSDQPGSTAAALEVSANGVTVGGRTSSTGVAANENDYRWQVTRYALDDGHVIWHRTYQAPAADPNQGFNDILTAMRLDAAGNVYAAGSVSVATGGVSAALIKYADNGDLQFVKLFSEKDRGIQPSTLTLNAGNGLPTFYSRTQDSRFEVAVVEFGNPAVVSAVGSLANISTRVRVGGDANVLIGGFIVTGPAGGTKKVLVRAIGPSLKAAGVAGTLADTTLELRDSAGHVFTNDNWRTGDPGQPTQTAEIEATGVAPTDNLESALIATVPTGPATAKVTGKGGAAGVGLVEVYDLDGAAPTQLANISTRGHVETDTNVMIGGIIALQPNPARVLVRAIGPSLTALGVANALQDPQVELRDVNGTLVVANDDWKTREPSHVSQQTEVEQTSVAPSDPRESAARVTLDPGNYTAIVRGKGGTTGVALVEVYHLP